ncbi:Carnitine O-acetyltransferase [Nymphon striatum]|nr:Carnitine O-acetyltransferase [Nymphon striatum]
MNGLGVDRHLLGLKLIALENGEDVPDFFREKGFVTSSHFRISSSQVPTKCNAVMVYGPLVTNGYGCCYNPQRNSVNFGLSASNSCPETNTESFMNALQESLTNMHDVFLRTPRSKFPCPSKMPSGQVLHEPAVMHDFSIPNEINGSNQSASDIFKSVKEQRVLEIEHASFTPLVFGTNGGMGTECQKFVSALATKLAEKKKEEYSEAQFEQLTRELEEERQSVAHQLEKVYLTMKLFYIVNSILDICFHSPNLIQILVKYRIDLCEAAINSCKIARENSVSTADESNPWSSKNINPDLDRHKMSGSQLADPCIVVNRTTDTKVETKVDRTERIERTESDQEHVIEGPTDVQDSRYNVSYHPTPPNGHLNMSGSYKDNNNINGNNNPSPNSSQMSVQDDPNAQLISRSTSQTRTQQTTTVTKVIREVKHLGPDGQPIDYPPTSQSPYSTGTNDYQPPHSAGYGSYRNYSPAPPLQQPQDYGTYDSSHGAPSPAVGSTRSYQDYDYHPDYSPRSNPTEDPYSRGRRVPPHDFPQATNYAPYPSNNQPWDGNRPLTPPSPTSTLSTSPPTQRAMPQAPAAATGNPVDYSHSPGYQPTSGYHELDSSLQRTLPRDRDRDHNPTPGSDIYASRQSPSPPPGVDRYGPYGHHNNSGVPTTPSPYSPYEATDRPIGYLDMKPSYADPQTPTGTLGHSSQQGRFGDEDGAGEYDRQAA